MANMAHCRFENTNADIKECLAYLAENDPVSLSASERMALRKLILNAQTLVEENEDLLVSNFGKAL